MRSFIAIDLPEDIREELSKLSRPLEKYPGLSHVQPTNFHCTLVFLGEQVDEKIELIKQILENSAKSQSPIMCKVSSLGVFPDERYPKVIWAGLDSCNQIESLAESIQKLLVDKKFIPEPKNQFKSHVTLARVKYISKEDKISLLEYIKEMSLFMTRSFEISEITLKKSTLTPNGPVYSDLAHFCFGDNGND